MRFQDLVQYQNHWPFELNSRSKAKAAENVTPSDLRNPVNIVGDDDFCTFCRLVREEEEQIRLFVAVTQNLWVQFPASAFASGYSVPKLLNRKIFEEWRSTVLLKQMFVNKSQKNCRQNIISWLQECRAGWNDGRGWLRRGWHWCMPEKKSYEHMFC